MVASTTESARLPKRVKAEELKLARQLVKSLSADFEPEKYHDEYQQRLRAPPESKQKGQEVTTPPTPKQPAPVVDTMEALKKNLAARGGTPKKPPARAIEASRGSKARSKTARWRSLAKGNWKHKGLQ